MVESTWLMPNVALASNDSDRFDFKRLRQREVKCGLAEPHVAYGVKKPRLRTAASKPHVTWHPHDITPRHMTQSITVAR